MAARYPQNRISPEEGDTVAEQRSQRMLDLACSSTKGNELQVKNLEGVDVVDDEAGRSAPGDGYVGENPCKGECGGNVALLLHPLRGAGGEEGEDDGEGGDEQPGQRVDDGELLEDYSRGAEGCQEGDVLAPYSLAVGDVQVGEAVLKGPAEQRSNKTEKVLLESQRERDKGSAEREV